MTEEAIELLIGLLEQYSPTGNELCAAGYFVGALRCLGFTAELDPAGNAVGVLGDGPREIMLLGHIDSVPGLIPVHQDGDRLYGRGAVDAKGPLACFAAAAAQAGASPGWRLRVVGAVGEEGDSRGARYLVHNAQPPELVVIGEPSSWDHVCLGYKGSLWLDYVLKQPLEHTAGKGGSACDAAFGFWGRLLSLAETHNAGRDRPFDQVTPSLREMHSASDGFGDIAQLKINIRLPVSVSPQELLAEIEAMRGNGDLRILDQIPAYKADKNTPLVRAMLAAIRGQGGKPGFSLKTGTADMNLVGPAWNCPILAYGPGDSSLDHTPQEHILVSEYLQSIAVLSDALQALMKNSAQDWSPKINDLGQGHGDRMFKPQISPLRLARFSSAGALFSSS